MRSIWCHRMSICLSICRSVTSQYCIKMAKCWISQTVPYDSPMTLVLWCKRSLRNFDRITNSAGTKCRWVSKNYVFWLIDTSLAETPYCRTFVSICHSGPHPQHGAGGGTRGVIIIFGGSRNWWSQLRSSWHRQGRLRNVSGWSIAISMFICLSARVSRKPNVVLHQIFTTQCYASVVYRYALALWLFVHQPVTNMPICWWHARHRMLAVW